MSEKAMKCAAVAYDYRAAVKKERRGRMKSEAALRECTADRSPRKGRAWLSPRLKKVIHDSRERVALASDGAILAAVPSLYDPAMGAVTPPDDVPDWKAVVPQCAGTAWRVDAPALAKEIARAAKCAAAVKVKCLVKVMFGGRKVYLDAEYLKRAFRMADALGSGLELRADERTPAGPVYTRNARFTLAIMPFRAPDGDAACADDVVLDGDSSKVVSIPGRPPSVKRAAAVAAWDELERMSQDGCGMRLHKIHGVDKSECCVEQMLAYNVAFTYSCMTLDYALSRAREEFTGRPRMNVEAVCECLANGFERYRKSARRVFGSYRDVGEAFPLNGRERK